APRRGTVVVKRGETAKVPKRPPAQRVTAATAESPRRRTVLTATPPASFLDLFFFTAYNAGIAPTVIDYAVDGPGLIG
ncbi:hypothetical protein DF186_25190, partial [Enterococcus hirae]